MKIHMYGLLLCSSYLIIFGVSSLNYNHRLAFTDPGTETVHWQKNVIVEDIADNGELARAIRDSLGLIGWDIPWETHRDSTNNLHFVLGRPGKKYTIQTFAEQNLIKTEEVRTGYWPVIRALHALNRVPRSSFMTLWGYYLEISVWFVFFGAVSGVYLWTAKTNERIIGYILLGVVSAGSLLFMVYVWLVG